MQGCRWAPLGLPGNRLTVVSTTDPRLRTAGNPLCAPEMGPWSMRSSRLLCLSLHSTEPVQRCSGSRYSRVRNLCLQVVTVPASLSDREHVLRMWLFPEVEHSTPVTTRQHTPLCPLPFSSFPSCVSPVFPVCLLSSLSVPTPTPEVNRPGGCKSVSSLAHQLFPGLEVTWYYLAPGLSLPKTWVMASN